MVKNLILIFFGAISFSVSGQVSRSFEFLNTPNNARTAALGGVNVSLADIDVNLFFSNPALVGDSLSGWASAGYQFYLADAGQATFAYAHDLNKLGPVTFGVQHLSYGKIKGYDATGMETGEFNSSETAVVIGKSHQISAFRLGANLRYVSSAIAGYRADAVLLDLGGVFVHPRQQFMVGLVFRNLGIVLREYTASSRTKIPFDVQVGASIKPEHMPVRFSVTGYNLGRTNILADSIGNETPGTLDKVLAHFNFAAEILLHKNVNVLVGYNYLLHRELKLENGGGGAGISAGLSVHIKSVEFVFSRNGYVAGKAGYTFTIMTNIKSLLKRR